MFWLILINEFICSGTILFEPARNITYNTSVQASVAHFFFASMAAAAWPFAFVAPVVFVAPIGFIAPVGFVAPAVVLRPNTRAS